MGVKTVVLCCWSCVLVLCCWSCAVLLATDPCSETRSMHPDLSRILFCSPTRVIPRPVSWHARSLPSISHFTMMPRLDLLLRGFARSHQQRARIFPAQYILSQQDAADHLPRKRRLHPWASSSFNTRLPICRDCGHSCWALRERVTVDSPRKPRHELEDASMASASDSGSIAVAASITRSLRVLAARVLYRPSYTPTPRRTLKTSSPTPPTRRRCWPPPPGPASSARRCR